MNRLQKEAQEYRELAVKNEERRGEVEDLYLKGYYGGKADAYNLCAFWLGKLAETYPGYEQQQEETSPSPAQVIVDGMRDYIS